MGPLTGLSPRCFGEVVGAVRREQAADRPRGRHRSPSPADRVLLVTANWRANLKTRPLAPLSGIRESAADRIIYHLDPLSAPRRRSRFSGDTVLIVEGVHHAVRGIARPHNLALTG